MCKVSKNVNKCIYYLFLLCYILYVVLAVNIRQRRKAMLKSEKQDVVYSVLSCIFAVILIVVMIVNGTIIDFIYLGIVSVFVLKYFIEIRRK